MDDDTVQILLVDSPSSVIQLHPFLCKRLDLEQNDRLQIAHSEIVLDVAWVMDENRHRDEVAIPRSLAKLLLLDQYPFRVRGHIRNHQLRIGPLIGVLCNPAWNSKNQAMRAFPQLASLYKLTQVGHSCGAICFLFRLQDVDFEKSRVNGYLYSADGWKRRVLPLPDAVYDQVISRKLEQKVDWMEKRKELSRKYGNRIFNDGFFDKWQVHVWLSSDLKMKPFILNTVYHTTIQHAVMFVQKYQTTFLKPVHGSLGVGIVRFVRQPDGAFTYDLKQSRTSLLHGRARSAIEAVKIFETRLKRKPYLWQEGISLVDYKERPIDVRILLQRDGAGVWKRTKMFARVAKTGDFTSNLSGGGEALPIDCVLADLHRTEHLQRKCRNLIARVSRLTVKTLEQQSGRNYGELGIDLGLDTAGHVWVIEVNAKPRKSPTTEKGRQDLVDLSYERPIQYAIHLAMSR